MDYISVDFLKKSEESDSRDPADMTQQDNAEARLPPELKLLLPSKHGLQSLVRASVAIVGVTVFVSSFQYLKRFFAPENSSQTGI